MKIEEGTLQSNVGQHKADKSCNSNIRSHTFKTKIKTKPLKSLTEHYHIEYGNA